MRRQELQIEACITCQLLRNRLVEPNGNLHSFTFCCDHHTTVKVVVIIAHTHLDAAVFTIHLTAGHLGHQVPLLRGIVQSNSTTLNGANTMMNNLDARILLVVESAIKAVAEYENVNTLTLEILTIVKSQILCSTHCGGEQGQ